MNNRNKIKYFYQPVRQLVNEVGVVFVYRTLFGFFHRQENLEIAFNAEKIPFPLLDFLPRPQNRKNKQDETFLFHMGITRPIYKDKGSCVPVPPSLYAPFIYQGGSNVNLPEFRKMENQAWHKERYKIIMKTQGIRNPVSVCRSLINGSLREVCA